MTCIQCDEPITEAEAKAASRAARQMEMHQECFIRSVAGSVGHQMHCCSCYGGHGAGDNPTLTFRENAKLAALLFNELNRQAVSKPADFAP